MVGLTKSVLSTTKAQLQEPQIRQLLLSYFLQKQKAKKPEPARRRLGER